MRFTDRVASLPPAVVTITFFVLFIGSMLGLLALPFGSSAGQTSMVTWSVAYSISMIVLVTPLLLWHYSIYRAASDRSASFVGHRGRRAFLFAICAIAMPIFLITFPMWMSTPFADPSQELLMAISTGAMIIACFSYMFAIWAAANALTRFGEKAKKVQVHHVLGTFILEVYAPIGVWVIHRRIRDVTDTPLLA